MNLRHPGPSFLSVFLVSLLPPGCLLCSSMLSVPVSFFPSVCCLPVSSVFYLHFDFFLLCLSVCTSSTVIVVFFLL